MTNLQLGDILIGGAHGYLEHIQADGTFVQHIPVTDLDGYPLSVNGIAIDADGNFYTAAAPVGATSVPHDVVVLPDRSGLLYLIQTDLGSAQLQKYDFNGRFLQRWSIETDTGWTSARLKLDVDPADGVAYYTDSGRTIFRFDVYRNMQLDSFAQLPASSAAIYAGFKLLPTGGMVIAMSKTGDGPRNAVCLDGADETKFWTDEVNPSGQFHVYKRDLSDGSAVLGHVVSLTPDGLNDQVTCLGAYPRVTPDFYTMAGTIST